RKNCPRLANVHLFLSRQALGKVTWLSKPGLHPIVPARARVEGKSLGEEGLSVECSLPSRPEKHGVQDMTDRALDNWSMGAGRLASALRSVSERAQRPGGGSKLEKRRMLC